MEEEKEVKSDNKTLEEMHKAIDAAVNAFTQEFVGMMPNHDQVTINKVMLIDHLLVIKEKAKFLVNNYVAAIEYDKKKKDEEEGAAE